MGSGSGSRASCSTEARPGSWWAAASGSALTVALLALLGCSTLLEAPEPVTVFPTRELVRAAPMEAPERLRDAWAASGDEPGVLSRRAALVDRDGPAVALTDPAHLELAWWHGSPTTSRCQAVLEALDAHPSPEGERALAMCGDLGQHERFAAPGADPEAVTMWGAALVGRGAAIPDFVFPAAVRTAQSSRNIAVQDLLRATCDTDRPERAAALREILHAFPQGRLRAGIAAFCPHQRDPELAALYAEGCRGCDPDADPLVDPDAAVRVTWHWLPGLFHAFPSHRSTFVGALERCARDPGEPAAACLEALAAEDWDQARLVAATRAPAAEPAVAQVQATLDRYADADALLADLRDRGVLLAGAERRLTWRVPEGSPLSVLRNHGQVVSTYDALSQGEVVASVMARIPDVREAIVEEIPEPSDVEDGRATLRVWIGDHRYQRLTDPWGAGVGPFDAAFLNAVLEAEGSSVRVGVPQAALGTLVFGDGAGLQALHDARLLPLEEYRDGD
ncbi:MAG: hypothetical protein R3F61_29185 [Myxococcota bacterium]